jgi:thymidylate kinase
VPPARPHRFVGLIGVDGSGKTFLLNRLSAELIEAGVDHRHVWSRFRNYLSKPLLGLARLTGHNVKAEVDGVRIGYHEFARSRPLALLFLALQASTTSSTSSSATASGPA